MRIFCQPSVSLKEKDEFALEAFSPAARLAIVRLLEAIYADQYLHKLVGSKIIPVYDGTAYSAKQAYQISEQAHNIRGKKANSTQNMNFWNSCSR